MYVWVAALQQDRHRPSDPLSRLLRCGVNNGARWRERICRNDGTLDGQSARPSHWLFLKCEGILLYPQISGPDGRRQRGRWCHCSNCHCQSVKRVGGLEEVYFTYVCRMEVQER